jgi:hypothetical protein
MGTGRWQRVGVGAALTAAVSLAVLPGVAQASMGAPPNSLVGNGTTNSGGDGGTATGNGAVPGFSFDFHVHQNGASATKGIGGYFKAKLIAPAGTLIAPQGPATCVDVQGNRVGFLYPLKKPSRPGTLDGTVIFITAVDGGPGHPDRLGFIGPAPAEAFPSCHPLFGYLPVTRGHVTVGGQRS